METIKNNLVFIGAIIAIFGIGIVWFFLQSDGAVEEGIIAQPSQFAAVRAEILGTIQTLQEVRLDVSVLDDQAFRSLFEAPPPPDEPLVVGRRNPFIPED